MEIVFTVSIFLVNILFVLTYSYYKIINALQSYQQSAYANDRYIKYIKENYKYTLGINEILVILILLFIPIPFIQQILTAIFLYYNLQFFQMSKKRFTEKLPLKITPRIKRQIITLIIIMGVLFISILKLSYQIYTINFNNLFIYISLPLIIWLTMIYFINFIIIFVGIINSPIEKAIQNKFKKMAQKKIIQNKNLCVIGITGSYGKTSIKNIINSVLCDYEVTLQTPSSFNTPMGLSITVNNNLNNLYQNFIAEMGAYYKGEIKELCDLVHPQIGVVSSIGPQHLETFKNIETIQETKMELIESLPENGLGVLNYDNKYIREYKIQNNVKIKWYSLEEENVDLYAYDIQYLNTGTKFKIKLKENNEYNIYEIETKLLGKHSIYNILSAIIVADFKGISINQIISKIKQLEPIEHRLELKIINKDYQIIDDSFNANIDGLKEGVNILSKMESVRKILITPGLIDGGKYNDKLNKEFASSIPDDITDILIIGNYNKDILIDNINNKDRVKTFDNFIDGMNYANLLKGTKTILIANDLPDKYNK